MREQTLHRLMMVLVRDLEGGGGLDATCLRVVEAGNALVAVSDAAGVVLTGRRGDLRSSAATDPVALLADGLQSELGQGAGHDAAATGRPVLAHDLASDPRWPEWAPRVAEELGVRSVLAVPLATRRRTLGSLDLYAAAPAAFDERAVEVADAVAAHASVALANARVVEELETGLANRTAIGQATGVVMNGYGMTSEEAFDLLVRVSSRTNRKLAAVAQGIVADHDHGQDARPAPRPRDPLPSAEGREDPSSD